MASSASNHAAAAAPVFGSSSLTQGGVLDLMDGFGPRAQTGLTIVLYLLSQKFSPLGYESNVMASQMLMNFQRHSGESIDAALCRYDTVRYKAAQEANLDLGPAGTTYHMLNALQVSQQMWTLLLQPFQGNMPTTEQELIQLQEHLRRQGHLMEGVLNKGHAESRAHGQSYIYQWTPGGPAPPADYASADPSGPSCSSAPAPYSVEAYHVVPGTECEHCGMYIYDEDDDGSDSATTDEDYQVQHVDFSNERANELHHAYIVARRNWRSFAGKPTRFKRRPFRKGSGKQRAFGRSAGRGKSGKGLGFGKAGGI